ncbi:MAG: 1-deoxy-D-xylulose-5-phosphate synthase [Candidatus Omnitrophica bacterium]|nr:1-deoxy-D-xylulose-5-phosphate synthase [Candidatus Omnitrophota bacterium]
MPALLDQIQDPTDLRRLSAGQLPQVAQELREEIIRTVSQVGGHFGGPLGAIELVVALHYAFNTPIDKLVWDVGYQAYAHKILTGRRDRFHTLRQFGGISGFPHKDESPYDLFTIGHGATSISTALGLANARDLLGESYKVVAIIGDGSIQAGMALEALNHAGYLKKDILIILNDNKMAIAPNVGALTRSLNRILTDPLYNRVRKEMERRLARIPRFGFRLVRAAKRIEESLKNLLVPGILFEEFGLRYFGPVDGHDINALLTTFQKLKPIKGPLLLHVLTTKGKGYPLAEQHPWKFHGVTPFEPLTGEFIKKSSQETFTQRFGKTLISLAKADSKIVAITAAMPDGTGLVEFSQTFPDRFYDVGMAEQHAVALAAGLAKGGAKPVVAIYSTFLQRSYDQIIHDVCLQTLPVIFCMDRAGLVGEDGVTHHGVFDISYLGALPNIVLLAPRDLDEFDMMLQFAMNHKGPIAIRYPRGGIPATPNSVTELMGRLPHPPLQFGKAEWIRPGRDLAIIAAGTMTYTALEAAFLLERESIDAAVINARFLKPFDSELLDLLSSRYRYVVTLEEGSVRGGFGAAILSTLRAKGNSPTHLLPLGLPDQFFQHGKRELLLEQAELSPQKVFTQIKQFLGQEGTISWERIAQ